MKTPVISVGDRVEVLFICSGLLPHSHLKGMLIFSYRLVNIKILFLNIQVYRPPPLNSAMHPMLRSLVGNNLSYLRRIIALEGKHL